MFCCYCWSGHCTVHPNKRCETKFSNLWNGFVRLPQKGLQGNFSWRVIFISIYFHSDTLKISSSLRIQPSLLTRRRLVRLSRETSARERWKLHTDDVKSVKNLVGSSYWYTYWSYSFSYFCLWGADVGLSSKMTQAARSDERRMYSQARFLFIWNGLFGKVTFEVFKNWWPLYNINICDSYTRMSQMNPPFVK